MFIVFGAEYSIVSRLSNILIFFVFLMLVIVLQLIKKSFTTVHNTNQSILIHSRVCDKKKDSLTFFDDLEMFQFHESSEKTGFILQWQFLIIFSHPQATKNTKNLIFI